MKQPFSKKLLIIDYIIAVLLVVGFFVCVFMNGNYAKNIMNEMVINGIDVSGVTVPQIYSIDGFGILLGTWIVQLGVSSGAYYMLARSEHKIQLPMAMINEMPQDIKDSVDMTQVITTVLSTTDN